MQKLGKKFPDHLQKSVRILITEYLRQKNLMITQHIIGQSCSLFSKVLVYQSFLKIPNPPYPLVPSLVRSVHNHRWYEL